MVEYEISDLLEKKATSAQLTKEHRALSTALKKFDALSKEPDTEETRKKMKVELNSIEGNALQIAIASKREDVRDSYIEAAAYAKLILRDFNALPREELQRFKAKVGRKPPKPGPSVTIVPPTEYAQRLQPRVQLSQQEIKRIEEQNKVERQKAEKEQAERLRRERMADAIKNASIQADNMTWDSHCPCCSTVVAKAPRVTVMAFGLPFCQPCIETHFPKLDAALKAWHLKYPDLTAIDFAKALRELAEAAGQDIRVPPAEYGIISQPGELVLD